jgi:hypothetical protein
MQGTAIQPGTSKIQVAQPHQVTGKANLDNLNSIVTVRLDSKKLCNEGKKYNNQKW